MKTYQSFARVTETSEFINTEIKAKNRRKAAEWFVKNTYEHERIYLKKQTP